MQEERSVPGYPWRALGALDPRIPCLVEGPERQKCIWTTHDAAASSLPPSSAPYLASTWGHHIKRGKTYAKL